MGRICRALFALVVISILMPIAACQQDNPNWRDEAPGATAIHESLQRITDVIVHDIFSPPQAARIYAYAAISGYEAGRHADPALLPLAGQINGLLEVPQPDAAVDYSYPLAAGIAVLETGKELIFSEDKVDEFRAELVQRFRETRMPDEILSRSVSYGEAVAEAIKGYTGTDNYKQSRTYPKFSITSDESRWRPTPPDYMDGIEPHWATIRPFVLDSAQQFKPLPPPTFDLTEGSRFHTDLMEVYEALDTDTEERVAVASFWDCNPFVSHHRGHVMFATKKISPGGHWMGIAKTVAKSEQLDFPATIEMYARVSISLADGFISCWDEKYRSKLVRPETLINQFIDEDWQPALQTPPFPEYTSGHSVISRAAAVAMTDLFGDNYAYIDSVEVDWGLPAREFESFYAASEEAAVSRLYGGIHYGPAIWEGMKQGQAVGDFVTSNLQTRTQQISKAQGSN